MAEKATSRRRARANYGFAILAYTARNLPEAKGQLDIVLAQDPASYSAYLYRADILGEKKDAKGALADHCAAQGRSYFPFDTFHDVRRRLTMLVGETPAVLGEPAQA